MELKNYQKAVMKDLTSYLTHLNDDNDLFKAWKHYWGEKNIAVGLGGVPAYNNAIAGVPHVCMKVPTGGGKTFMACAAVRRIFDEMPKEKPKVVVWLVPSDPILLQTTTNLTNPDHPYRQRLNADFAGRVGVYTKEMLLNGQNFSPDTVREMLTVCILSYGSLRIDSTKKDVRKVYQENGNLLRFAEYFKDDEALLADTPDTALIQVLRHLSPVVIVDESHNAGSALSVEMLNNLNPSFVLDLTATPRKNSNIISYVDARELKKENMVKLPVIVFNRNSSKDVIEDAINLRNSLEQQAIIEEEAGGRYIRPIVLFQAQPKTSNDSETFEKIKKMLIDLEIPENQIAIKTSKVDTLGKTDLMSRECPIRFIITVDALKEGWDCPFAYVLASIANKTSRVSVEQILGRILRQPYARKHQCGHLNTSYVLSCSANFHDTLENIVKGLNSAGFSRKDYRVGETEMPLLPPQEDSSVIQQEIEIIPNVPATTEPAEPEDVLDSIDVTTIHITPIQPTTPQTPAVSPSVAAMLSQAEQQNQQYEDEAEQNEASGLIGGELGAMMKQYTMQPQYAEQAKQLRLPQFFVQSTPDLFGGDTVLLEKDALLEGFTLSGQDASVNFTLSAGEVYTVDIQSEGDAVPKYKRVSQAESDYLRQVFARMAPEEKIESCTKKICYEINRNKSFATSEVEAYVRRVIANMTEDELAVIETSFTTYARKIKDKIDKLQDVYREATFYRWLDEGKIICQEYYSFPDVITPPDATDSAPLSLYEAECDDMNKFEANLRDVLASTDSVEWWHRVIARKGFRLNAFGNHYPDFIVKMKSGRILLVESKGDDRDNGDSKSKLKLGKAWASNAGKAYRYFMVFDENPIEGAYTIADFAEMLKGM
ncbi:MAG: DEAD/DEAH box helicase family protein [Ruminococcus sp.]|nr:DEAD/DEAH box helicase family protein [Ruminococcus sp.]